MYPRHFGVTFRNESDFEAVYRLCRQRDVAFFSDVSTRFDGIGLLETVQRLRPLANDFTRAIELGVDFLLRTQRPDGNWDEPEFTGTGFPVHFYLNYHNTGCTSRSQP